jgi:hypothetical protein
MQDVALVLFESEGRVPHSFAFCANEWVTEPSLRDEIPRLHDSYLGEGKLAEACASRTHRRRGDPPPDGFEDRGSHRTACASAADDPYSSSIGVVHGLAGSIRAGETGVSRHAF